MSARKLPIQYVFVSLCFSLVWGLPSQAIPQKQSSAKDICKPLGRVAWAQGYSVRPGQIICKGQILHGSATATLKLLCFDTLKKITFNGSTNFSQGCRGRSIQPRRSCQGTQHFAKCARGVASKQLTLVRPFGNTIIERRPTLEWEPVRGATHYKIEINGFDVTWKKTVHGNRLSYPKGQSSLTYGNKYNLTFFAYRRNKLLTTQKASLLLLPEQEVRQIIHGVQQLKQIPLTQTELATDLDYIYMTRNLLNNSIETLKYFAKTPAATPEIHQLLTQRLEEAGHSVLTGSISTDAQFPTKVNAPQ